MDIQGNFLFIEFSGRQKSTFCYAEHKYPYDWRTKKPTIFRATEQWFASVEGFREAVMDAISSVKWIPAKVLVLDCIIDLFCTFV